MRSLVMLCSAILFFSCQSSEEKIEAAIYDGELGKAETIMTGMSGAVKYRYSARLIDEYLSIGNIDRAVYVFNVLTPHCTMYESKFNSLHSTATYTAENARKIYDALLNEGRYDECWAFHSISYNTETYPGNAPDFFSYMSDVIVHLCAGGKVEKARRFIAEKSVWFMNNVDNHEWGHKYPDYRYSIMREKLDNLLDSLIH